MGGRMTMKGVLRKLTGPTLVLTLGLMGASQAIAQDAPDINDDIDRATDAIDRLNQAGTIEPTFDLVPEFGVMGLKSAEGSKEAEKRWKFTTALPFTFATNATAASTDASSSFHGAPAVGLGYTLPLGGKATLAIGGAAALDAYTEVPSADTSTLSGSVILSVPITDSSGAESGWKLSGGYVPLAIYSGQYGGHVVTLHMFNAGISRAVPLSTRAIGANPKATDVELSFGANVMRREATVATSEQWRFTGTVALTAILDDRGRWSWSNSAAFFLADYTGGTASTRQDEQLKVKSIIAYKLSNGVSLTGGADFTRQWSNIAGKEYTAFDVGPTLALVTKF